MYNFQTVNSLRNYLKSERNRGKQIGFVPTMGALHEGHLSLIRSANRDNDITIASIYVNPTQFNDPDDYRKYPRNLEKDLSILEQEGVNAIFAPSDDIIYGNNQGSVIKFDFGRLDKILEGEFRPGHFNGVATIVLKFLNIVEADHVYFGQKDLQQYVVIKTLINDIFLNTAVHRVPTARRPDGLALSSRNERLTGEQSKVAPRIYESLKRAKQLLLANESINNVKAFVANALQEDQAFQLEYFEIVDAETFEVVRNIHQHEEVALCIAAFLGEVRLIDNILLFS